MQFEWDDRKNASNFKKHRISFETAALVFDDPLHTTTQDRDVDGEERWQTVGLVDVDEDETVRIISARKATPQERRRHEGNL
jgi:uncharacterized DUF497 family protein